MSASNTAPTWVHSPDSRYVWWPPSYHTCENILLYMSLKKRYCRAIIPAWTRKKKKYKMETKIINNMPMKEGEIETIDGRECLRRASKVRSDLNGMAVTHASSVTIRTHLSANRKCTTQTVFSPRPTIRTLAYKNSCMSCVLRPVINGQFDRSIDRSK